MGYIPPQPPNWRLDPGLEATVKYKRKFAYFPVTCSDGTQVWFKHYFKKYELWTHSHIGSGLLYEPEYLHTDFIENTTEEEYIVRKLAETL